MNHVPFDAVDYAGALGMGPEGGEDNAGGLGEKHRDILPVW
jgi:hypothetical protein